MSRGPGAGGTSNSGCNTRHPVWGTRFPRGRLMLPQDERGLWFVFVAALEVGEPDPPVEVLPGLSKLFLRHEWGIEPWLDCKHDGFTRGHSKNLWICRCAWTTQAASPKLHRGKHQLGILLNGKPAKQRSCDVGRRMSQRGFTRGQARSCSTGPPPLCEVWWTGNNVGIGKLPSDPSGRTAPVPAADKSTYKQVPAPKVHRRARRFGVRRCGHPTKAAG